jgi:DNA polymerase-3 subunit alpha
MEDAVELATKRAKDKDSGQINLFDLDGAAEHGFETEVPPPEDGEWEKAMKLAFEKESLGMYVSDHPLRRIANVIEAARTISLGDDEALVDGRVGWVAGILTSVTRVLTRNGKQMIDFHIEDLDGFREGRLFGNVYTRFEPLFVEDAVLRIRVKVEVTDRGTKLQVIDVMPLADGGDFSKPPGMLVIRDPGGRFNDPAVLGWFKDLVPRYPGPDSVQVEVAGSGGTKTYLLPAEIYSVDKASRQLHAELREVFGTDAVHER